MKNLKRVYICSSLKLPNVVHVTETLAQLPKAIHLRPRPDELFEPSKINTVSLDIALIKDCDELWQLGRAGLDCLFELGFATALGKKIRILFDGTNKELEDSWMYLHGTNENQVKLYFSIEEFKQDFILETSKITYIASEADHYG